jgi:hypothetical protein
MSGTIVFDGVYNDTYKKDYQKLIDSGMDPEQAHIIADGQAKQVAGEASAQTVRINTLVNSFINVPQLSPIFRSMSSNRLINEELKAIRGESVENMLSRISGIDPAKNIKKELIRDRIKDSGLEAVEEIVNVLSEESGFNIGRAYNNEDIKSFAEVLSDKDTWAAAFWGAVGGTAQNFILNKMPKYVTDKDGVKKRTTVGNYNNEQVQKVYEDQLKSLSDRLTEFIGAKDQLIKTNESGDVKGYNEALDKIFKYESFNSIVKGTEEQLIGELERISRMPKEDAAKEGFKDDYQTKALNKIQQIKDHTKEWNNIYDRYNSTIPEAVGYPEVIFGQYLNIENNKNLLKETNIEIQKLQAEFVERASLLGTDLTVNKITDLISSQKALENDIELATVVLDNIDLINTTQDNNLRKRLTAKYNQEYGGVDNAYDATIQTIESLNEKIEDINRAFDIEKENVRLLKDSEGKLSDKEIDDLFKKTIAKGSFMEQALVDSKSGKALIEETIKFQEKELAKLKSSEGLNYYNEIKVKQSQETPSETNQRTEQENKTKKETLKKIKEDIETPLQEEGILPETLNIEVKPITPEVEIINEQIKEPDDIYSGEGTSTQELTKQKEDIQKILDNSDEPGVVKDISGVVVKRDDRIIQAYNAIAYASTREYNEDNKGFVAGRASTRFNPESNIRLLTQEFQPGTKIKIKYLDSTEFTPYISKQNLEFFDFVNGKLTKVDSIESGEKVTFEKLNKFNASKPIGIYDSNGILIGMVHDTSYMREQRVLDSQNNIDNNKRELLKLRSKITNDFQDITVTGKTRGHLAKLSQAYNLNDLVQGKLPLAIAKSNTELHTDPSTKVNVLNKGLVKGQVYLISNTVDEQKIAIPLITQQIKSNEAVKQELMIVLDNFLNGKASYSQLQNTFSKYVQSYPVSKKLTTISEQGKEVEYFQQEDKDRYYLDYENKNAVGITFGKSGSRKYFLTQSTPADVKPDLVKKFNEFIDNVYFNINFSNLQTTAKDYLQSDVAIYKLPDGSITTYDNPVIHFSTDLKGEVKSDVSNEGSQVKTDEADIEAKKADIEKRRQKELEVNKNLAVQDLKTKVAEKFETLLETRAKLKQEVLDDDTLSVQEKELLTVAIDGLFDISGSNPFIIDDLPGYESYNIKKFEEYIKYNFPDLTRKQITDVLSKHIEHFAVEHKGSLLATLEGPSGLPSNLAELNAAKINAKYDAELKALEQPKTETTTKPVTKNNRGKSFNFDLSPEVTIKQNSLSLQSQVDNLVNQDKIDKIC